MLTILFGTVLPWVLIAVGGWLAYQLVRQNGRILLRLETIERHLGSRGSHAPRSSSARPAVYPSPSRHQILNCRISRVSVASCSSSVAGMCC